MFIEFAKHFLFLFTKLVFLFIIISFIVALVQKQFSEDKLKTLIGDKHNYISAIKGALIGFVTPFCSCSNIPLLIAFIQADVPFCATIAYLISSPLINPIVIILFLSFFGIKITIVYSVLTFIFSVFFGLFIHHFGLENEVKDIITTHHCPKHKLSSIKQKAKIALEDCYDIFKKMLPHIAFGVFIATLIHGFIPEKFISQILNKSEFYSILMATLLGGPLHVHPETMFPIADVLIQKGFSIGTIIALIISGAGTSLPEITMLNGIFKKKIIIIFILCVFLIAIISGYTFDLLF